MEVFKTTLKQKPKLNCDVTVLRLELPAKRLSCGAVVKPAQFNEHHSVEQLL